MTELPALRNDDTLGFLAALGVLEVLTEAIGGRVELGWTGVPGAALIDGGGDLDDIVEKLDGWFGDLAAKGRLVHPAVEGFPPVKQGSSGPDPTMMTASEARRSATDAATKEREGGPAFARWLAGSVNQHAREGKKYPDRQQVTPLRARSNQQTFDRNYSKALAWVRRDPDELRRSLTTWRRVVGFDGFGLDHRAERDSGVMPTGDSSNVGIPGATLLALHAVPLFRLTGNGGLSSQASLWQGPDVVWPLWTKPLDRSAVVTLVEHPAMRLHPQRAGPAHPDQLAAIGVGAVAVATRGTAKKSDGALGSPTLYWIGAR